MKELIFKSRAGTTISFGKMIYYEGSNILPLGTYHPDADTVMIAISVEDVNKIINHLANQLRSIGEPIDLLNKIVE
jgi:hypothetical protein